MLQLQVDYAPSSFVVISNLLVLSLLKRAYHYLGTECKIIFSCIFRHQNWWESCWNSFFLYAPTHTFDEKKTRNSNSQKKILVARPTFLVHVQNWEKIIARTVKIRFELLRKDISAVRRSWEPRFGHKTDAGWYFSKIWKSDVDFHYFGLFRYVFSIWSFSPMRKSWASCLHW